MYFSQTHHLHFAFITVICHQCLMRHTNRKWVDHVIKLKQVLKNATKQLNSTCPLEPVFFPLSFMILFLFYTHFTIPLVIYYRRICIPVLVLFFPPTWLHHLHFHWHDVIASLRCWKMRNEDKLSLILSSLHSVHLRAEWDKERKWRLCPCAQLFWDLSYLRSCNCAAVSFHYSSQSSVHWVCGKPVFLCADVFGRSEKILEYCFCWGMHPAVSVTPEQARAKPPPPFI